MQKLSIVVTLKQINTAATSYMRRLLDTNKNKSPEGDSPVFLLLISTRDEDIACPTIATLS